MLSAGDAAERSRQLEPVIGLEIHVQLATAHEDVLRLCAVLRGAAQHAHLPGLPRPARHPAGGQRRAVHFGLMIGLALGCDLAPRSIFHRKNYFYPDLPEGLPDLPVRRAAVPRRAALGGRAHPPRASRGGRGQAHPRRHERPDPRLGAAIVDFNRGGTPLVEIVTEPDLRSAEQAREWLRLLRATLRLLGVSDVNMEEGSLRCDANVSLRPAGQRAARAPRPS